MKKILICWIGTADLKARRNDGRYGLGPTAQAVREMGFDEVVFLSDHLKDVTESYARWLETTWQVRVQYHRVDLKAPTHFGDIYDAAVRVVSSVREEMDEESEITFHLSPGTPQMCAVWVILAKTRFPAQLIESSQDHGVNVASVPFDISADMIPDLLRKPDERLEALRRCLPPEAPAFGDIIRCSPEMETVILHARNVALRSVSVHIEGESGTGKELLARAIHGASPRNAKPFVAVNCGAIPEGLIESELFGHAKGAFTGAVRPKKGAFEEANGGTLFLDEVGELKPSAQVALLRAMQERKIVRVGGVGKEISVDVRIISATNRNLEEEVGDGRFREDLYYRLCVYPLDLPPLRTRSGDLTLLIDHLLEKFNEGTKNEPAFVRKKLSTAARNVLHEYSWPGNVRELDNIIQRAALTTPEEIISEEDIRRALQRRTQRKGGDILDRPMGAGFAIDDVLADVARHYLERAIQAAHGNMTRAAEMVGLSSRQTLTNWMKKYGMQHEKD